jgi:inner membrane protein
MIGIAVRKWFIHAFFFAMILGLSGLAHFNHEQPGIFFMLLLWCIAFSFPAFIALLIILPFINWIFRNWKIKMVSLFAIELLMAAFYGMIGQGMRIFSLLDSRHHHNNGHQGLTVFLCLSMISLITFFLLLRPLGAYFSRWQLEGQSYQQVFYALFFETNKTNIQMETVQQEPVLVSQTNRIFIKGLITAALILLMLIPTLFIQGLITEREGRQKEVVKEVSSKWADAQTIPGIYLVVPYADSATDGYGKTMPAKRQVIILPSNLDVKGNLFPEERPRSIFKVLLYKTSLQFKGQFKPVWPADILPSGMDMANSRLCFNLSDLKGIQEELYVTVDGRKYLLSPGLPVDGLGKVGLSVPVSINLEQLAGGIPFELQAKLKGSERLSFLPLSANSSFSIASKWPNPSFDGNALPVTREVKDTGFLASWSFNRANLPFPPVFFHGTQYSPAALAFGVSLVQPADQYNKTMRSVKYAILIIGLSFALFFIIELRQRKPFHPVQYVLVGMALVIFYTLLLSISEYILFDHAYLIAAVSTMLLITLYAKSHFGSWKTAGSFGVSLSCLYAFIFILISLEDTALLVGSIGLFMVLALVMYASRKVKWYGSGKGEQLMINS